MRIYLGLFLRKLAIFTNALIPALLSPADLTEFNKRVYKKFISAYSGQVFVDEGLSDWEKKILDKHKVQKGRSLVLFCGGGRDSIALAKSGLEVTGIDVIPEMIERAKINAQRNRVEIDFRIEDVLKLNFPPSSFDYVIAFRGGYSQIPGRRTRIELLKIIYDILIPGGSFVFDFSFEAIAPSKKRLFSIGKIIAYASLGNFQYQTGDKILASMIFSHVFPDKNEIFSEINHSAFQIKELYTEDYRGYAILRKYV